ncbi:uncharacterized protein LOC105703987 [Orussus abietinus]|uniref:uncharacterized protein LOC105703987 n=1 Tax=Orussus abietinus TaxID=222816 RepID=UPI000C715FDE|nr:uncharacterized protein LOC105703987 [Orussus abietinus]
MTWRLLMAFLLSLSSVFGAPRKGCEFPKQWMGGWFQSGVTGLIVVNETAMMTKGQCIHTDGEKFLLKDWKHNCHRCIVIHEKHTNVLQYKETYCYNDWEGLDAVCDELTGDAALNSLFRSNAAPSTCPFKGPLQFTYSRGEAECRNPMSLAETCTQDSRILLRYQACADVARSESTEVELECLATWREGSTQYLVVRLYGERLKNDEDRYRCFIYEKSPGDIWNLAQSGDATCNGLLSVAEGAKTFKMEQVKPETASCSYPTWITSSSLWVTLDSMDRLQVSKHKLTILDHNETHLVCHSIVNYDSQSPSSTQPESRVMVVAKATRECKNGFVCLVFHKRDDHIIEVQQSKPWTQHPDEACRSSTFTPHTAPYTTFITEEPMDRQCPYLGRYEVVSIKRLQATSGAEEMSNTEVEIGSDDENDARVQEVKLTSTLPPPAKQCHHGNVHGLDIGCRSPDRMEFATSCADEALSVYRCHGTWEENGTAYLVASTDAARYCLVYSASTSSSNSRYLSVTGHLASCPRASHPHHQQVWQVNLTAHAQCSDVSSAWSSLRSSRTLPVLFGILLSVHVAR